MENNHKTAHLNLMITNLVPTILAYLGYLQGGTGNIILDLLVFCIIFLLVYSTIYYLKNYETKKLNLYLIMLLPILILYSLELNSILSLLGLLIFTHLLYFTGKSEEPPFLKDSVIKYLFQNIPKANKYILIAYSIAVFVLEWNDIDLILFP